MDGFQADLRSLAATRISIGALILFDLGSRARDLSAHYTDDGVLPHWEREYLASITHGFPLSLHLLNGSAAFEGVLFAVSALIALALLLGLFTRTVSVASFVLVVSLQNRTPQVLFGGDAVLRLVLFWGMFVPWGARFSLDSWRSGALAGGGVVSSPGVTGMLLQPVLALLAAFFFKHGTYWLSYLALEYILGVEPFATSLGRRLQSWPGVDRVLTGLVLVGELLAPLLMLIPRKETRLLGFLLLVALMSGIGLLLDVGFFPVAMIAAALSYLPGAVWDRLGARRGPAALPPPLGAVPSLLAGVAVAYVVLWNVVTLIPALEQSEAFQGVFAGPGYLLRLDQRWSMFAPAMPTELNGWLIASGDTGRGREVELVRSMVAGDPESPPSFLRTRRAWDGIGTRWRDYLLQVRLYREDRPLFTRFLCRRWDRTHPGEPLQSVSLIWMKKQPLLHQIDPPLLQEPLYRADCASLSGDEERSDPAGP